MSPIFIVLTFLASTVVAHHANCTTTNCADLCNFQGSWITTAETGPVHGYCVCNDMYYTLESDTTESNDDDPTNSAPDCNQRRKSQLTAFMLHANLLIAPFAPAHWYLGHVGIAVAQMLLGLFGGFAIGGAISKKNQESIACMALCSSVFIVWWFVDLILFIRNNHYNDQYGGELYPW